jgi:hypothetical protein
LDLEGRGLHAERLPQVAITASIGPNLQWSVGKTVGKAQKLNKRY